MISRQCVLVLCFQLQILTEWSLPPRLHLPWESPQYWSWWWSGHCTSWWNRTDPPLPKFSSFECLAAKCKPPLFMTILVIYRPPKPNPAFIPEMHDLLTTLCTTCANMVILGDMNIHVDEDGGPPATLHLSSGNCWIVSTWHSMWTSQRAGRVILWT